LNFLTDKNSHATFPFKLLIGSQYGQQLNG
jgi:hypothetical protein